MAKNKITDLRDHLFETLEKLKDGDESMPLARARVICEVAQKITDTAKVEVEMVKALDRSTPASAAFFNMPEEGAALSKLLADKWRNAGLLREGK
jgi:hypothetical protein